MFRMKSLKMDMAEINQNIIQMVREFGYFPKKIKL